MKRNYIFLFIGAILLLSLAGVFAASCNLQVSLVNQDPDTAVQGDSVKLLFQVSGVENPECKGVVFKLDPEYSFSFADRSDSNFKVLSGSTYFQDYKNTWIIPYTLKVNKEALDGDAEVQVFYAPGTSTLNQSYLSKKFSVRIQDSRADFEVYVRNYNPTTKIITFEILNTAKVDIKALTMEVPKQESIKIKGSNVNIVGDLDSNEYTTADFEGTPSNGEITLKVSYTDQAEVRRIVEEVVNYDSSYFEDRVSDKKGSPVTTWIIVIVVVHIMQQA